MSAGAAGYIVSRASKQGDQTGSKASDPCFTCKSGSARKRVQTLEQTGGMPHPIYIAIDLGTAPEVGCGSVYIVLTELYTKQTRLRI